MTSFARVVCLQNPGAGPIDHKSLLILPIRGYQRWISPGIPARCRFYPSCSQYAVEAIREYGVVRGLILGAWRILRCNPFCRGGYDPVPDSWGRAQGAIPPGGGAPGRDQEPDATGAQTKS